MAYEIIDKTKKQATKCPYMFQCLNNEIWNTCSIRRDIQGAFLVIETKSNKNGCPYCFSYGDSDYCHCPARREIYRRYKK